MTMLEKAARALAAEDARRYEESSGRKIDLYAANPEMHQRLARAVLLAVREPDESSRECAKCAADPDWLISGDAAGKVFTATIDAILNEEPSNG